MIMAVSGFFVAVLSTLSALHIYWALGGKVGLDKAVPTIDGKPAFQPGTLLILVVASALLGCAYVSLSLGFSHQLVLPYAHFAPYAGWGLAVMFAVRAIGDFKLVGFFKKIKGTVFATLDSRVYSPLCLVLSVGFVALSWAVGT